MIDQFKPQNLKDTYNSSLLVCVFNNAKDSKNLADISKFKEYPKVRLNCSVVNVRLSVSALLGLVNKVSAETNNYSQMGLAGLNVYYVVHPDTRDSFSVSGPLKNYQFIRSYMLTYGVVMQI